MPVSLLFVDLLAASIVLLVIFFNPWGGCSARDGAFRMMARSLCSV